MSYMLSLEGFLYINPSISQSHRALFEDHLSKSVWEQANDHCLVPKADWADEEPQCDPIGQLGALIAAFLMPNGYGLSGQLIWHGRDGARGTVSLNGQEIRVEAEQQAKTVDLSMSLVEILESGEAERILPALDLIYEDYPNLKFRRALLPYLTELVEHKSPELRLGAVNALSCFIEFEETVLPAMTMALTDPMPWVRSAAAGALGAFGGAAAPILPALKDLARDRDRGSRHEALCAIDRIQKAGHANLRGH